MGGWLGGGRCPPLPPFLVCPNFLGQVGLDFGWVAVQTSLLPLLPSKGCPESGRLFFGPFRPTLWVWAETPRVAFGGPSMAHEQWRSKGMGRGVWIKGRIYRSIG